MSSTRVTGQVKWFNTKAGYGFITGCGGEHKDHDIFVHYSSIKVVNSQYRYLVQGEYVEFNVVKPEGDKHEHHAVNVTGINGGSIMCESRRSYPVAERPRPLRRLRRYQTQRPDNNKPSDGETTTNTNTNTNSSSSNTNHTQPQVQSQSSGPSTDEKEDGFKRVTRGRPRRNPSSAK
jgi:cold shock CspA family protein